MPYERVSEKISNYVHWQDLKADTYFVRKKSFNF